MSLQGQDRGALHDDNIVGILLLCPKFQTENPFDSSFFYIPPKKNPQLEFEQHLKRARARAARKKRADAAFLAFLLVFILADAAFLVAALA